MADIAPGLNFRIGADVKNLNKAIREAEKSLKGAVSSFSSIGNSLSLALTAPIAAFTGISIKAAGDLESLRLALEKTMGGAGRSIGEAKAELEELRKAALAPGLDFEQAVRGSIRLQGVGYEAEQARKIIVQLANALSLAGGTADQLDGVTKQFTQMIGKGKIMQEDLTIILENMPNLAKVMKDTFGTSNAEMLRKMGVSVEDFIAKLTDGMAKLPRAQGGIANSIVNAQNAIKLAIAEVGEEINKTFNVTGALENFAKWVGDLGKWFRGLDDSTKRAIGAAVIFLATLGPMFKVMQAGVFVVGKLQIAFLLFQKALAVSMTSQGIPGFIAWWKALDAAMKATIIGATIAVVLALGIALTATAKDMSAAAQAQRNFDKTMQEGANSIALERAEMDALVSVAKNEKASKEDRLTAMKNLIAINPKYKEALNGEVIDTVKLAAANREVVESMIQVAKAKAAVARIAEIDTALSNLSETAQPDFWQKAWNVLASGGNLWQAGARDAANFKENVTEATAALEAERAKLMEVATANVHVFGTTKDLTGGVKGLTDKQNAYLEVISDIANVSTRQDLLGSDKITEQAKAIENGIKKLLDLGFAPASEEIKGLVKQYNDLSGIMRAMAVIKPLGALDTPFIAKINDGIEDLTKKGYGLLNGEMVKTPEIVRAQEGAFTKMVEGLKVATGGIKSYLSVSEQMGEVNKATAAGVSDLSSAWTGMTETLLSKVAIFDAFNIKFAETHNLIKATWAAISQLDNVFAALGTTLVGTLESVAASGGGFEELAKGILGSLKKIIGGLIKAGVAAVVQGALIKNSLLGVWAVPIGIAAGSIAQIAFNNLLNKIKVPELARGGVLTSPQLVMAGEYAGARANPEIITPENKMRDVFGEVMAKYGGGTAGGTLVARVAGDDLLFVLQKAEKRSQRIR